MLVRDILDDCKEVFGQCPNAMLYRRLSQAVRMLANSGGTLWDGLIGYMDIAVDTNTSTVTLPRDVLTPIQVNFDDRPTFPRDRWFEFHVNGVGGGTALEYNGAWDDKGFYPTMRTLSATVQLTAISSGVETGKTITIFGKDADDREISETLTLNFVTAPVTVKSFKQIDRIDKDVTTNVLKLYEYISGSPATLVGWYYSNETDPQYRRIRVSASTSITMLYRRRTVDLTSEDDYIPLENPLAVIQAARAVHYRYRGMIAEAQAAQKDAVSLLEDEQDSRNVNNSTVAPQVLNFSSYNEESLYSGDTYR